MADFPLDGDLSASQILKIKLKAEQMWDDSALAQEYIPHSDTAIAVLKNQTARFRELENPDKDNQVVVNFINPCGITVEDCGPICDMDGKELSTGGRNYELDTCKSTQGLKINREKFRTNLYEYEELAAKGLLMHLKALDEFWSQKLLAKMKAYAGVNVAVASNDISAYGMTWENGATQIPATDFNLGMLTTLLQQQIVNNMPNGYIIDRGYMFKPVQDALLNADNADGKGDAKRAQAFANRITHDMFNFAKAGVTDSMFAINPGAIAFKTRARNPETPKVWGGKVNRTDYKVKSRILPGVEYDVYYSLTCVEGTNGRSEIHDVWNFKTEGGIFLNPEGCPVTIGGTTYNPTGIYAYDRIAA